jgi:hypothetical protein
VPDGVPQEDPWQLAKGYGENAMKKMQDFYWVREVPARSLTQNDSQRDPDPWHFVPNGSYLLLQSKSNHFSIFLELVQHFLERLSALPL